MTKRNVYDILVKYLNDNNFDGLSSDDGMCCCDSTYLAPCGDHGITDCRAGYKITDPNDDNHFYICDTKDAKPWEDW